MKKDILKGFARSVNKFGFKLKTHSPEILVVAGVVGTVTSTVMACKATTKLNDILENAKNDINAIHYASEHPETLPEEYTMEDSKKDLAIVYAQTGLKVIKLYAPSVILGSLSITAMLTSNNILRKRNVALAAAYAGLDKSFKEYRGRVVERFGKELDRELKYNIKAKEIEETVVDEKTGKEKKIKKTVNAIDPSTIDDMSRIWYEGNTGFTDSAEYNLMFLKRQQEYATDKLKRNGFLVLNDVYEMLGFSKTREGAVIGWVYDEKNPVGDNFVDFGIYDKSKESNIRFVNGDERAILLEFNHDGYIVDKI